MRFNQIEFGLPDRSSRAAAAAAAAAGAVAVAVVAAAAAAAAAAGNPRVPSSSKRSKESRQQETQERPAAAASLTTAEMEDEDGETTSKLSELLKKNRIKPDRLQEIVAGGISSFQITLNDVENFLWKDIDDEDIELLLDLSGALRVLRRGLDRHGIVDAAGGGRSGRRRVAAHH